MTFRTEHLAEGVTLILGDCREWLATVPSCFRVDVALTDPPYGIGVEYGSFTDNQENVAALPSMKPNGMNQTLANSES